MAGESAFNKRHVEASTLSDVEGLLEHLNLPPAAISYIRKNKRMVQIVIAVVIAAIVAWSLYGSYREKRIERASSALAVALEKGPAEKAAALEKVFADFAGTSSALWAKVELAHLDMQNGKFAEAAGKFSKIKEDLDAADPLYALTVFGIAQAQEANHDYQEATATYGLLKDIEGYQLIAHTGIARIQETQGETAKAIETLNKYLASLDGTPAVDANKKFVEEKLARLKVRQ